MFPSRVVAAAAVLAFSAPTEAQAPGQTIIVWSYGFSPHPIVLEAGRPVTLTFQNRSGGSHDFTARTFFAVSTIRAGSAPGGQIELAPYETKKITLIPRLGTYRAHCSHFMHALLGMNDQIIVS